MNIALPINAAPVLSAAFHKAAQSRNHQDIADYLLIEKTELAPADAILVFGNPLIAQKSAEIAAQLYAQKLAPVIIVSGGNPGLSGRPEATEIYEYLRDLGVDDMDIIEEARSQNTQQNVLYSKACFAQICNEIKPDSLIGIGHVIAGRRFLMTIAKNWPEITLPMAWNVWEDGISADNWHTRPGHRNEVIAQFNRVAPYVESGYIAEIDLDRINAMARARKLAL